MIGRMTSGSHMQNFPLRLTSLFQLGIGFDSGFGSVVFVCSGEIFWAFDNTNWKLKGGRI